MTDFERLGQRIAREQDAQRGAASPRRASARERVMAFERVPARPDRRALYAMAALGAGALAAAAFLLVPRSPSRAPALQPLALRVGASDEPVRAGTWVEAPASGEALRLSFSDGTRIDMAPRSRMRVIELQPDGAHLLLESGRARVAVVPRPHAAWRLSVGPFAVRVVGTRFDVGWDPDADAFELDLEHGAVELSGCVFASQYRMRGGQAVEASCRRGQLHVKSRGAEPAQRAAVTPAPPEPAAAPQEAPAPPEAPRQAGRSAKNKARSAREAAPDTARDWRTLAAEGEYGAAFERARAAGFSAECERADEAGLALLAETARHAGAASHEEEALLSLRSRFAGTPRAAFAAFALGRLEFDKRHAHAKAAQWFGIYLKEQPQGTLVRQARGRLIEATLGAGDRARARELAVSYLRDHPAGPHAALARSVIEDGAR